MKLLLDAHTLLWWLADDPGLAGEARSAIASESNEVLVSAATIWEIAIKRSIGKLTAPDGLVDMLAEVGFEELPITGFDAERAAALPRHHRDPFDRMLVAQASRIGAVVVTRDRAFTPYEVATLPA